MDTKIKETIEQAESIALATIGNGGVNVIPISVISVVGDEIHLYDFFMNKTAENIKTNPEAALVCWTGFEGVQVKAQVSYDAAGEVFEAAVPIMKERFPERTLKAVLKLAPTAIHDVAPGSLGGKIS
tara:strand:+ start:6583 stop:6963 length:381 start_codon:yes stop_codon:yes gene_type:complete